MPILFLKIFSYSSIYLFDRVTEREGEIDRDTHIHICKCTEHSHPLVHSPDCCNRWTEPGQSQDSETSFRPPMSGDFPVPLTGSCFENGEVRSWSGICMGCWHHRWPHIYPYKNPIHDSWKLTTPPNILKLSIRISTYAFSWWRHSVCNKSTLLRISIFLFSLYFSFNSLMAGNLRSEAV